MESISQQLQPFKEIVGSVASVVTIAQFFSPVFLCYDIYKKKSTKDIPAIPFIGGLIIGVLVLKYALILEDKAMFQVNVAAIILNFLYIAFYHLYSEEKWNEIYKPLSIGVGVLGVMFTYIEYEQVDLIEFRYGLIVTLLSLSLLGSPLLELADILRRKDASKIPFPLVFMGSIVSFLWLLYGFILANEFMIVQNIIGLVLCIIQLFLCFIYPGEKDEEKEKKY